MDRRQAGTLRVRAAMEHVEKAQREIGRAQADLCAVVGYARENDRLVKLYAACRTEWYRLDSMLRKPPPKKHQTVGQLDREPVDGDADGHLLGCGGR